MGDKPTEVGDITRMTEDPELVTALYRHLFENLRDAAFLADAETGIILDANEVAARLLGRSRNELIGLHQSRLHPASRQEEYRSRFRNHLVGARPDPSFAEIALADGSVIPVTVSASSIQLGDRTAVLGIFRDAREALQAERAVMSEAAFRSAIEDSVLAGVVAIGLEGEVTYVSPAFCRMVGFTREELLGQKPPYCYWAREDRAGMTALLTKMLAGRSTMRGLEVRLLRKDGTRFECYMQVSELRVGNERVGWLAALQDISLTKQVQEAFAHAVAAAHDGFWLLQATTGLLLDVNQAYCRMSGYSRHELVGKRVTDIDADENDEDYARRVEAVRLKGGGTFPVRHRRKDGSVFELEVSVSFDRGRDLSYAFFRDITARLRAESDLRESERRYRMLFETMSQAVTRHAPDGTLLEANAAALRIFKRDFGDLVTSGLESIGEWLDEDGSPADPSQVPGVVAVRTGQPVLNRLMGLRLHGTDSIVWLNVSAIPQSSADGGQPSGMYIISDDVSERVKAERERQRIEAQLHQAQRLESLGVIAGGIAHDFNNLLTGILGNVSFVRGETGDARQAESLGEAERACHRAVSLTGQFLTFAKGGAPVKKTIDLAPLIRETLGFCLLGTAVEFEMAEGAGWAFVEADPGQVAQVFQNIVINAVQAMSGAGRLHVTLQRIHDAGGSFIRTSIRDTGIGIPPEQVSRIFDPYFTTKGSGSGLGLAVAHSIVHKHGGRISVQSDVGRGTVFDVDLPVVAGRAPRIEPTVAPSEDAIPGRILIMDDEPLVAGALARILSGAGHEVAVTADGDAAIDRYRQALSEGRRFDLVVVDLTVRGGMGGQDAMRHLRAIDPAVCVVVSSGYAEDPVMAEHARHGFAAMLPKPYRRSEVLQLVNSLLAGASKESEA